MRNPIRHFAQGTIRTLTVACFAGLLAFAGYSWMQRSRQVLAESLTRKTLSVVLWPEPRVTGRFAAALIMFVASMFWGAAVTAFAQQRSTTVDVGRTKSYGLLREVYPRSINISSAPTGIAEVSLDTDKSKLRIRGVSPGSTVVTVSGTYRRIEFPPIPRPPRPGENRPPREVAVPFRHTIRVTVLPRILEPDRRAIDIPVSRGFTRTYQIHIFMGPVFRNENEEGVRWRNFRVTPGDNNIARAGVNRMRIGITGVNGGQTTITLTGERLFQGTWQRVVRDLQVRVGAATSSSWAGTWKTSHGKMILVAGPGKTFRGSFDWHKGGRIIGSVDGPRRLVAYWIHSESNTPRCVTERDGSYYWGRYVFTFNSDWSAFEGLVSSCDEKPSGAWSGKRSSIP